MIKLRYTTLVRSITEVLLCYMPSYFDLSHYCVVNFDHLIKVVSDRDFYYKIILFLFVINKYFVRMYFEII